MVAEVMPAVGAPVELTGLYAASPAGAPGRLRLVVQGNRLLDSPLGPRVSVDGYPLDLGYGEHLVEVPAGRHRVEVHCQWLRRYGAATAEVEVPSAGSTTLHYAPPRHEWAPGRMGTEPQQRAGALVAGVAVLVALYLTAFVANLLLR